MPKIVVKYVNTSKYAFFRSKKSLFKERSKQKMKLYFAVEDNRLDICLPVGGTALGEHWPPLQPISAVRFLNKIFSYRMGLLATCPTPILEDQGVSFSLDSTL
jgi:hypothetical protein